MFLRHNAFLSQIGATDLRCQRSNDILCLRVSWNKVILPQIWVGILAPRSQTHNPTQQHSFGKELGGSVLS